MFRSSARWSARGRPRTRHLPDEERLPARCDHRAPVDRGDLLPRAPTARPRSPHISILPSKWPARGGFLGGDYDAFQADDPLERLPDVTPFVTPARDNGRTAISTSSRGLWPRPHGAGRRHAPHGHIRRARALMSSEQLKAFDITQEPLALRRSTATLLRPRLPRCPPPDRGRRPLR